MGVCLCVADGRQKRDAFVLVPPPTSKLATAAMAMAASLSALPPSNGELGRSSSARVAMSVSRPVPPVDLPALQSASRVLQDQLLKDVQVVPELGDMLSIRTCLWCWWSQRCAHPSITIAGVTSSANYSVFPEDYRAPFQRRQHVAIPEGLFRHYNSTCICVSSVVIS